MGMAGGERVPLTHMHMYAHARMCTHDIIGNSQGFCQWGLPFAIEIIMFNMYMCMRACAFVHVCVCMCVCACVCMHVHVHMCGGHPQPSPTPIQPPPPQSTHP